MMDDSLKAFAVRVGSWTASDPRAGLLGNVFAIRFS